MKKTHLSKKSSSYLKGLSKLMKNQ